jgi:D-alanyl-D-alanine carboxypeptidase
MFQKMLCVTLFACLSMAATAQQLNTSKLDSLFNSIAANNKGMGSIAIAKNGKLLYTKTIGYTIVVDNRAIPANSQTKYRIGSITKMFTATMIFQLIDEKKLALSTPLSKYFPKVPNAGKITVEQLLGHRSGIHNFTDDSAYLTWYRTPKTQEQMVDIIAAGQPDFEPGAKPSYSNSNYVLLGYIIEKLTGKPYKDALQQRIVSKLALKNTYYGGYTNTNNNEALSYEYTGDHKRQSETDMSIPGGAGAIVSTPTDLTIFIQALFNNKLVSKKSLELMSAIKDGYGLGMFQFPLGSRKAFGHNGGIDGFTSMLGYFPSDSLAIAYCSNETVLGVNDIMIGALSICFNLPYTIPSFKTLALNTADLDKYLGTYSSKQIPLKLTITKDGATLKAQATGQGAFPLEATEPDKFKFDQAGIELQFDPAKNELTLKQGGGVYLFTKDN